MHKDHNKSIKIFKIKPIRANQRPFLTVRSNPQDKIQLKGMFEIKSNQQLI